MVIMLPSFWVKSNISSFTSRSTTLDYILSLSFLVLLSLSCLMLCHFCEFFAMIYCLVNKFWSSCQWLMLYYDWFWSMIKDVSRSWYRLVMAGFESKVCSFWKIKLTWSGGSNFFFINEILILMLPTTEPSLLYSSE